MRGTFGGDQKKQYPKSAEKKTNAKGKKSKVSGVRAQRIRKKPESRRKKNKRRKKITDSMKTNNVYN